MIGTPRLSRWLYIASLLAFGLGTRVLSAQALPTASGQGPYIAVGGGASAFPSDYDGRRLGGGMVFVDVQPAWFAGLEAESRFLRMNTDEGVDQTNYLAGPRIVRRYRSLHPYAKFLVGATKITAPFGYARGTFFTYAPGAGADLGLGGRFTARLIDVEYQMVPNFIGSNVRNLGLSVGLSFRLNALPTYPTGRARR